MYNPFESLEKKLDEIQETLKLLLEQKEAYSSINKARELLTRIQAAKYLGISERTVINLEKSGRLMPIRIGKSVRYDWQDIEEFKSRSK